MKTTIIILLFVSVIFLFVGCSSGFGGTILDDFEMESSSQIEMIEESLSINLDSLNDTFIKEICSFTDTDGNDMTVRYIDLDGAGELIEEDIANSDKWSALPYDSTIENLLESSGASEQFDFASIPEGYFIMSGVKFGNDEFDFDRNNVDEWYTVEIGIWDTNDETLYHISITNQSKS